MIYARKCGETRISWQAGMTQLPIARNQALVNPSRASICEAQHLRRVLTKYFDYYNRYRVHQSLKMDAPDGRRIQPIEDGKVIAIPHVFGLHHHYERRAA